MSEQQNNKFIMPEITPELVKAYNDFMKTGPSLSGLSDDLMFRVIQSGNAGIGSRNNEDRKPDN